MRHAQDRLLLSLLIEYFTDGSCTPGTVESFAQAFGVPRSRMNRQLKALVKSGLMRSYHAHGQEHFVLDAVEF